MLKQVNGQSRTFRRGKDSSEMGGRVESNFDGKGPSEGGWGHVGNTHL